MQYLVLFTSLLLGATATPVEQRQTAPEAQVSSFTAHTNLGGTGASIGFDFEIAGLVSAHCSYSDTTSGSRVPNVGLTDCDDQTVRWEFFHEPPRGAPYRLVVVYTPAGGPETYTQALPETDFPEVSFDNSTTGFVYVGEPKFGLYRVT
ncbi:hypothetical protein NUW58_g2848 [Xylaria curta]|uniref:Uncharacterized protein n=1 Tax=Xylaria curta TaxID=42375 RepID=A0ACC1PDP3_9PEZI|nr:hypothetical protein NUW58_g2848 [Xylaria curta]